MEICADVYTGYGCALEATEACHALLGTSCVAIRCMDSLIIYIYFQFSLL